MTVNIKREGEVIKFTDCPKNFEMDVEKLRIKLRKFQDLPEPDTKKAGDFINFYKKLSGMDSKGNWVEDKYAAWGWEILKFVRKRAVRMIPPIGDDFNIGTYSKLKNDLQSYIYKKKGKPFHFFASTYLVKHVDEENKPLSVKEQLETPYGFDMVIDVDDPKIENAIKRTWKIINYIEDISPIEFVDFSGKKGFHIWILYETLKECWGVEEKETYTPQEIKEVYKRVENKIRKAVKIKDIGHAGKTFQQIRVPYSIHPETNLVDLPLTREQLENFNLDDFKIESVYEMDLRNRGTIIFG